MWNTMNVERQGKARTMDFSKSVPKGARKSHLSLKKRKLGDHLAAYCNNTSIAGFRYLTEQDRPWYERLLWVMGIVVGCGFYLLLARKTWERWTSSPVIVSMGERLQPIWQIPFPAVTICPYARIKPQQVDILDVVWDPTSFSEEQTQILADVTLQCESPIKSKIRKRSNKVVDYIELVAIPRDEILSVVWFTNMRLQKTSFQPLLTETGLCQTFNMLPNDAMFTNNTFHSSRDYLNYENVDVQWNAGEGYSSSANMNSYPYRALQSGSLWGLTVILIMWSANLEYYCSGGHEGFEVTVHNPWEFPQMRQHSFSVPLTSSVQVAVTPEAMMTSEELHHGYSPQQRQCYFPEERTLRFFKQYTRNNCELECLANITFLACECVAFYMPRELDTPICDEKDNCLHAASYMFQVTNSGLKEDIRKFNISEKILKLGQQCNCLQSCTSLNYQLERSRADVNFKSFSLHFNSTVASLLKKNELQLSLLTIFYKESHFIPTRRLELYDTENFIANCGGLLGLCLGMSFLSILELLYWLLVRPFRRSKKVVPQPVEIKTLTLPALYKRERLHLPHDFYPG